jgi:rod shape-determining protein MreC
MDGVKMRGIITGGARDILLMKYLTDVREVPVRSRVLTSGLGGVFPRGIDIGTLLVVTNKMSEVTGEVSPTVDFSTLEDVFIRCEK